MSEDNVDLCQIMAAALGCTPSAAKAMVLHGSVYIDEHCVRPQWVNSWSAYRLRGRTLKCPLGEFIISGGKLEKRYEQMRLE